MAFPVDPRSSSRSRSSQLPFKLTAPPWRSATIPLSAFISTVISGFERFYDTPRAVPYVHTPLLSSTPLQSVFPLEHMDLTVEFPLNGTSR